MSLHRAFILAAILGAFVVMPPVAHAAMDDMSGITGTPNDGGIDTPPAPGGGGTDPILDGCTNSPEAPTFVLGMLGVIGIGTGMSLRSSLMKRRQTSEA